MSLGLQLSVRRCGLIAPGLADWPAAVPVLLGRAPYQPAELAKPVSERVPPRERRRHTFTIALALAAAHQVLADPAEGAELPAVFACSGGDTDVIDRICQALTLPERPVSPQQFLNSVHNAPAGYWSIADQNQATTQSLSAYDASFAAGLLEAGAQIAAGAPEVLLVAYDVPAPAPIWPFRPLHAPCAVALLLGAAGLPDLGELRVALTRDLPETTLADPELERLRGGNPAARGLPILAALAQGRPAVLALPYLAPAMLRLEVAPA